MNTLNGEVARQLVSEPLRVTRWALDEVRLADVSRGGMCGVIGGGTAAEGCVCHELCGKQDSRYDLVKSDAGNA